MKRIKIYKIIITFIVSFFVHFIYTWFPNIFTSIFFPVNESVWEHMKIIYTSTLISSVIEYFMYKNKRIKINNFVISIPITSILGIIIYLIVYQIISLFIPHNLFISIVLLLIVYILMEVISYYILNSNNIKNQKNIGISLIKISYIIFVYLTYNPIKIDLFIDPQTGTYGIEKYLFTISFFV